MITVAFVFTTMLFRVYPLVSFDASKSLAEKSAAFLIVCDGCNAMQAKKFRKASMELGEVDALSKKYH